MIAALGDSLTRGFDGHHDLLNGTYPQFLSRILGQPVINEGFDGATLSGSYLGDLTSQVKNTHLPQYRGIILFYGTNDYDQSSHSLSIITKILEKNLNAIRKRRPQIKIYGILPLTRYDNLKNDDHIKGKAGYTFQDLIKALAQTYHRSKVPALNWEADQKPLITDQNFRERLNDNRLHPTKATYRLMARRIAKFMRAK